MRFTRIVRGGGAALMFAALLPVLLAAVSAEDPSGESKKVRAKVQVRPGGPTVEAEMAVVPSPTDPASVPAAESRLPEEDLVLGVVLDGKARAYPIRFLALYEIVNDRVGNTPVAPSW